MKLKEQIINSIKEGKDIRHAIQDIMCEQGLAEYNNSLMPGFIKGHWRSRNTVRIYKDECEQLTSGVSIGILKYGIKDKVMFYSIDHINEYNLTRVQEIEAKIWADVNEGIVGKTY